MKPSLLPLSLSLLLVFAGSAYSSSRTSANYSVPAEIVDSGGVRALSPNYTNDGSVGAIVGLSTVASPSTTDKSGYIAQLTELVSFAVNAAPSTISQGSTSQLSGIATLDDATTTAISGDNIVWASVPYPFASLSVTGLLTAANHVYSNPAGAVSGTYFGATGFTNVTVTGPYASSVILDSWFVQYFGPAPNADAAPEADADHTGQSNLFKFLAGLNPIDGSRFTLVLQQVPGEPTHKQLIFQPTVAGRTYTPQFVTNLLGNPTWQTVANYTQTDNGDVRTVTDLNADPVREFYRIEISLP